MSKVVIGLLIHNVQISGNEGNIKILIQLGDKIVRMKFGPHHLERPTERKQMLYPVSAELFQQIVRMGPMKIFFVADEIEIGHSLIDWGDTSPNATDKPPKITEYVIKRRNDTVGGLTMTFVIKRNDTSIVRSAKAKRTAGRRSDESRERGASGSGAASSTVSATGTVRRPFKRLTWSSTIEEMLVYD